MDGPVSYLTQELIEWQASFDAQPVLVQRFLDAQAHRLAEALLQQAPQVRFTLPDRVVLKTSPGQVQSISPDQREQLAGGLFDRLTRTDLNTILRQRLTELEASTNPAIAAASGLLRYATAVYMVHNLLPSGRTVQYRALDQEEIPTIPEENELEPGSAITAATDAIAEESGNGSEPGRGEFLTPFVPAARRFYLPQWVAFDGQDHLRVNTATEAEAHVSSMQRFLTVLHMAVALAPYMVTDPVYQQKRYGMLGQLVNQGRALARFQTQEITQTIQRRASANDLNRGLSLSLPYFDDQSLQMQTHNFEIIPAGRIMFVPAFVVRAVRQEQVKVAQDTRLNPSTRRHLLAGLQMMEQVFETTRA
jgi:hypothetical protein